jgi:probable F420-dependent oxidoreductase
MKFYLPLSFTKFEDVLPLARTAEEVGFDGVSLADHIFLPENLSSTYPYGPDGKPFWPPGTSFPDPAVMIGAIASVTSRLRFLTNIYILPLRNPFVVAQSIGTAAVLSAGRVSLGAGVGWMKEEFDQLGVDFHTRGSRADEMIQVLRALWSGGFVEHHGEHFDFDSLCLSPTPDSPIPIFTGGESVPALRRAAKFGDGWIGNAHRPGEAGEFVDRISELRAECDRDHLPFEFVVPSFRTNRDEYIELEEAGVTTAMPVPWSLVRDPPELAEKQSMLERFASDVIDQMPKKEEFTSEHLDR